ncbi:MAG: TonB-dependent receptor plug domain-containing protein [Chitinophagaceae bacterium]|nr:TonB-dependent receptor plug domain-containing protein [Chitinophagaceae bacterium]
MKKLFLSMACLSACTLLYAQKEKKFNDTTLLQPVEVQAIRAAEKAPFAKTDLTKKDIEKNNLGQDLPFLLTQVPSVVVNSDAGNGVGYTGIRIRGTDATRINVTLNGIPYNDAESQGTFFVDLPDFASSAGSIQVQRGVGTSTNGAGAFGASINLSTNELNKTFYVATNNSYGSFNTHKNNIQFGSGLLGNHFTIDGRLSSIRSEGYIDRAKSNLGSFYLSTAYTDDRHSLRLNVFSGREKTYQAWNGVPEYLLATERTFNSSGTEKPGDPYDNETDNYTQTHYQLFYNHKLNSYWKGNLAVFLTRGKGYYEQYKAGRYLADYGLPDYFDGMTTITSTDLVRRLWLDNYFYGSIFSLQYQQKKTQLVLGGGYNAYDGQHYGEIKWAAVQAAVPANYRWYDLTAYKKDLSLYGKWTQQLNKNWQSFVDIQVRNIDYRIHGFRDNPALEINKNFTFLNPKAGITYSDKKWQAYISYALAGKEPNRDDFEAGNTQQPNAERLHDVELGVERKMGKTSWGANLYYMYYHNQLVLTGKINDVGAYTRTNIPKSHRAGIELQGKAILASWMNLAANISFSENKIKGYTEYLDDYDNGGQQTRFYNKTDISFSPSVVAGANVNFIPVKNAEISLINKYVGRQYLDNTSQRSRSLNPYYLQDIRLSYTVETKIVKAANIILQLNNVFNKKYEPNGYSFSYIYGGELTTENYYYPMAGTNFMVGVNLKF